MARIRVASTMVAKPGWAWQGKTGQGLASYSWDPGGGVEPNAAGRTRLDGQDAWFKIVVKEVFKK